jgi:putative heme-binding domain-containing protein
MDNRYRFYNLPVIPAWACALIMLGRFPAAPAASPEVDFPRPVAVWPSGPLDLVLSFPRSITPAMADSLVGRSISYRESRPATTGRESSERPLGTLRIAGARLADSGRTLVLSTDPHPRAARYRIHLGPDVGGIDVDYDLSGAEAAWSKSDEKGDAPAAPEWTGWWPTLNFAEAKKQTQGSSVHERGFSLCDQPGRLVISCQVVLPAGEMDFRLEARSSISEATLGDAQAEEPAEDAGKSNGQILFTVQSRGEPLFLTFTVETGPKSRPSLSAVYRVGKEGPFRAIDRDRLFLPWAPVAVGPTAEQAPAAVPDLDGGDRRRGSEVFFGDRAKCSQCHAFAGRGGNVGPDLSEIRTKGRLHVYQSIAAPSAEIAPDYIPYTVAARDGRVVAGLVKAEGPDAIRVTDTNARTNTLKRDEIDQIRPSGTSIMPVGLAGAVGPADMKDLIAYLMSGPAENSPAAKSTTTR